MFNGLNHTKRLLLTKKRLKGLNHDLTGHSSLHSNIFNYIMNYITLLLRIFLQYLWLDHPTQQPHTFSNLHLTSNLKVPSNPRSHLNHITISIRPKHPANTFESILRIGLLLLNPFTQNYGFPSSTIWRPQNI